MLKLIENTLIERGFKPAESLTAFGTSADTFFIMDTAVKKPDHEKNYLILITHPEITREVEEELRGISGLSFHRGTCSLTTDHKVFHCFY